MLAARIHELGAEPVVEQADEPAPRDGGLLVELGAASINPVDLTISRGAFYMPTPPRPYVAGQEGVGRVLSGGARFAPGTRVYTDRARSGTLAERFVTAEADAYELPDGDDDALAVALGVVGQTGWLTIAERAGVGPDDRVLVLAATGAVGSVALQAAKLLGAQLVVAAGREPERLERARALGADATVQLSGEGDELVAALREPFGDEGPTVVLDPLWGEPGRAALEVAAPHARIVQMGQSAGAEAKIASATLRGKALDVLGFTTFRVPLEVRAASHRTTLEHARAGRLRLDLTRYPLARAAEAWHAVASGAGQKPVVEPGA